MCWFACVGVVSRGVVVSVILVVISRSSINDVWFATDYDKNKGYLMAAFVKAKRHGMKFRIVINGWLRSCSNSFTAASTLTMSGEC